MFRSITFIGLNLVLDKNIYNNIQKYEKSLNASSRRQMTLAEIAQKRKEKIQKTVSLIFMFGFYHCSLYTRSGDLKYYVIKIKNMGR